jgi:hypothetical protein
MITVVSRLEPARGRIDNIRGFRQQKDFRVVAVAYQGLCTFEFGVVVETFALPRPSFMPAFCLPFAPRRPVRSRPWVRTGARVVGPWRAAALARSIQAGKPG